MDERLRQRVEAWLEADPDAGDRARLSALLEDGDEEALRAAFGAPLPFGTAGIRGPLGPGPAAMNRLVVRRVTAGLAAQLLDADPVAGQQHAVVVGRDARHGSAAFAAEAAGVLVAAGLRVHLFSDPVPTPLVAFATARLGVAAGVQITASHNPAADNGYKIFVRGGRQILAPTDAEIRRRIDEIDETATGVAVADVGHAGIAPPDPEVFAAYVRGALRVVGCRVGEPRSLRLAYTPMHGVARDLVQGTLEAAGFRDLHVVDAQAEPDPDFPTVDFPNPEEPGALDALLALADEVGADVALANDPDGDRIAVVARSSSGAWRALSGDETGCLLADDVLARRGRDAPLSVATTVVSSRLLARIASARNAHHVETLTGFKWLAAAALEEREAGREMALAYEQALGVMVGTHVLDKDGISAALAVADLADRLKAQGRGLVGALDDLARRHGLHVTGGRNIRLDAVGAPEPGAVIDRSRSDPPRALAGVEVLAVVDHLEGVRRLLDGGGTSALTTPSTPLVGLELEDGSRVQVRPSGTEPLLKCYGEVVETVAEGEPVEAARRRAEQRLAALLDALLEMAGLA